MLVDEDQSDESLCSIYVGNAGGSSVDVAGLQRVFAIVVRRVVNCQRFTLEVEVTCVQNSASCDACINKKRNNLYVKDVCYINTRVCAYYPVVQ